MRFSDAVNVPCDKGDGRAGRGVLGDAADDVAVVGDVAELLEPGRLEDEAEDEEDVRL